MPELAEVETIRRDLARAYAGRSLCALEILEPRLLVHCGLDALQAALCGRRLEAISRRGKFLVFRFGSNCAIVHLRMSGWFAETPGSHTRMVWRFEHKALYFDDVRRFGTLHLVPCAALETRPPLAGLGLEPLGKAFTPDALRALLNTPREVKAVLLDQTKLAGLGNIYACEVLHRARLHPKLPARRVSTVKAGRLHQAIQDVLREAIALHGSTLGSAVGDYRTLSGAQGGFQDRFRVYGREGQPCTACRTPIRRMVQAQRGTFFCPRCQRIL